MRCQFSDVWINSCCEREVQEIMSADNATAAEECVPSIDSTTFDLGCLAPAIGIILVLAFLRRRAYRWPQYCDGRPGIVIPVNFLRGSHNRYAIVAAFGTTASKILQLIIDQNLVLNIVGPPWTKVFASIIIVLLYGIIYYPLLACLTTEQKMAGSLMGVLYSSIRFSIGVAMDFECNFQTENAEELSSAYTYMKFLTNLLAHLCMLFLVLKFAFLLFKEMRNKWFTPYAREGRASGDDCEPFVNEAEIVYVKNLLSRQKSHPRVPERSRWFVKLRNKIYKPEPAFKFSTQVLSTVFVVFIVLYEVTLIGNLLVLTLTKILIKGAGRSTVAIDIFRYSGYIAVNLACLFMVIMILAFMKRHRRNVMNMWQSRQHVFPGVTTSPTRLVGTSLRYSGFQVAYAVFGYITYAVFLFITTLILSFFVKIADILGDQFSRTVVSYLVGTLPLIGVTIFVMVLRLVLARFVFKDNEFPDESITINNRRLYCVMTFFFFFLDVLVGAISCVVLIIKSTVLGVIFLPRLDRSSLMQGFQNFDNGYMAYVGLVHVLVAHKHPVLLMFCQLLINNEEHRPLLSLAQAPSARRSKQALNRWFLALTLMRNPSLIASRRQHVDTRPPYFTGVQAPDWDSKELLMA